MAIGIESESEVGTATRRGAGHIVLKGGQLAGGKIDDEVEVNRMPAVGIIPSCKKRALAGKVIRIDVVGGVVEIVNDARGRIIEEVNVKLVVFDLPIPN